MNELEACCNFNSKTIARNSDYLADMRHGLTIATLVHSGIVITLLTIECIAAHEKSDDGFCVGILTESSHDQIEGISNEEKEHS